MLKKSVFMMMLVFLFVTLNVSVGGGQAQTSTLPLLSEPGSYGVSIKSLEFVDPTRTDWTVSVFVWYPADKTNATSMVSGGLTLRDAPPDRSGAPYPLILYSPGYMGNWGELSSDMEHLTSQGYVVVGIQHQDTVPQMYELVNRPLDIMLVIDELAAVTDADLTGLIDTNNIALMGYSSGADTTLQMIGLLRDPVNYRAWCAEHPDLATWDCTPPSEYGSWDFDAIAAYRAQLGLQDLADGTWTPFGDARIHAVLAIAPCNFPLNTEEMLAAVTTPTMLMHTTRDRYCDYEGNAARTYTHLGTEDRYLITLVNRSHGAWAGGRGEELVQHYATAFFGYYLKGDAAFMSYLSAENHPDLGDWEMTWGAG